jgi:hypothetical protein
MMRIAVAVAAFVVTVGLVACGDGSSSTNLSGTREALAIACPDASPDEALAHLREAKEDIALSEEVGQLSRVRQREYVEIQLGKVC